MLPLSGKQTYQVTTKDGTLIELSYLLGRMQIEYFKIIDSMSEGTKLIEKAESIEKKYDLSKEDEFIEEKEKYDSLLSKAQIVLAKYKCDIVDMFVVKIGETEVKNVSSQLPSEDINELSELIQNNFDILTGHKKEELKN